MNLLKKRNNEKGFTMAELLIVVAIIAVLVAVAIPTFMSSLHNAQVASDEANARALYADLQADYLDKLDNATYIANATTNNQGTGSAGAALTASGAHTSKLTFTDGSTVTTNTGTVTVTFAEGAGFTVKYLEYNGGEAKPANDDGDFTMMWGASTAG